MRLLIVPDKFKGTLTASAAAKAIARGWASLRPGDRLELLPGKGNGTFGAARTLSTAANTRPLAADLNRDGRRFGP